MLFFFKQKTAYEIVMRLEFRRVLFRSAERPVALGGVMGGADSEVSAGTTDLLIESAAFEPISIRNTARKLNRSEERRVGKEGNSWGFAECNTRSHMSAQPSPIRFYAST